MELYATEKFLYDFENVKVGKRTFNRLVEIEIVLTKVDDISEELVESIDIKSLFNLLEMDASKTNEEMVNTLHELLSVVREGRHHTFTNKL